MNEHETTLHRTRPAARAASEDGPPPQTSAHELLEQARGFSRAARAADRRIQTGADALEALARRAQRGGQ